MSDSLGSSRVTVSYNPLFKFEGKERDTETGNDDFGARYYSNRFGRWLSADWSSIPVAVPYANLSNPQTLNLYAMVADDPESFADLDGHCPDHLRFLCNLVQRFDNLRHGLGFRTDNGVADIANRDARRLRDSGLNPEGMSQKRIIHTYDAFQKAIKSSEHAFEVDGRYYILGMIGVGGARFTSKTLWEGDGGHIDVENPNPGQRPGQIHYQDAANNKFQYNFNTGEFEGLSKTQNDRLLSDPDVQQAIQKGFRYLGIEVQPDVEE